jgi:glutathione reductase (NADPH)
MWLSRFYMQVGDATYTAENILVAVGSWPWLPTIPGIEHVRVHAERANA